MLAEALLSAWTAFFPLRLPHVPTAGPRVGVRGLPWRRPGGKREGPDAFMEGKALYSLRTCPPEAQVDLGAHRRWALAHPVTTFPQVGTREPSPKRMLEADRMPSGGSSVYYLLF